MKPIFFLLFMVLSALDLFSQTSISHKNTSSVYSEKVTSEIRDIFKKVSTVDSFRVTFENGHANYVFLYPIMEKTETMVDYSFFDLNFIGDRTYLEKCFLPVFNFLSPSNQSIKQRDDSTLSTLVVSKNTVKHYYRKGDGGGKRKRIVGWPVYYSEAIRRLEVAISKRYKGEARIKEKI